MRWYVLLAILSPRCGDEGAILRKAIRWCNRVTVQPYTTKLLDELINGGFIDWFINEYQVLQAAKIQCSPPSINTSSSFQHERQREGGFCIPLHLHLLSNLMMNLILDVVPPSTSPRSW